jgi:two-component system, OmpR family, alkaline phosphatase synthesis response regulator PhoP
MADARGPILVVDDSRSVRLTIQFVLRRAGFTTLVAADGEAGLATARRERPPVVLLDVEMPRLDGFEVCRRIREDPALGGTYVVMLTANGQQADELRALQAGADRYVTKPFNDDAVVELLTELLALPRA